MTQDNWADADLHEQSSSYSELYHAELHYHDVIFAQYDPCDSDLSVDQYYHNLDGDPAEDIEIPVSRYINTQFPPPSVFPICVEEDKRSEGPEIYPFYTFSSGMNFSTSPLKIFYKDSTFDHREIEIRQQTLLAGNTVITFRFISRSYIREEVLALISEIFTSA